MLYLNGFEFWHHFNWDIMSIYRQTAVLGQIGGAFNKFVHWHS